MAPAVNVTSDHEEDDEEEPELGHGIEDEGDVDGEGMGEENGEEGEDDADIENDGDVTHDEGYYADITCSYVLNTDRTPVFSANGGRLII